MLLSSSHDQQLDGERLFKKKTEGRGEAARRLDRGVSWIDHGPRPPPPAAAPAAAAMSSAAISEEAVGQGNVRCFVCFDCFSFFVFRFVHPDTLFSLFRYSVISFVKEPPSLTRPPCFEHHLRRLAPRVNQPTPPPHPPPPRARARYVPQASLVKSQDGRSTPTTQDTFNATNLRPGTCG